MQKNVKSIFLVATLLFLLVGVSAISASEVSDDNTIIQDTDDTVAPEVTTTTNNIIVDTTTKNIKTEEQSTDLYVSDTDGSDDNNGTNDSPYKTIQKALDTTTADSTYNIHIIEGTYKGLGNVNLTINGNYNINFIGDGINKTVFDGEASFRLNQKVNDDEYYWGSSQVWEPYLACEGNWIMNITTGNGKISIQNMTITHGMNRGAASITAFNTSTVNNYGNLYIDSVYFKDNLGGVGAAARNRENATIYINNSVFEGNRKSDSTGNFGAALFNNGTATMENCIVRENYARWGTITNDGNLTIINSTIRDNVGYDGGSTYKYGSGIAVDTGKADFNLPYNITNANTVIINSTFINNDQSDIYLGNSTLLVDNCIFNRSTGIYLANGNDNHITHNITNNDFCNMIASTISTSLSVTTGSVCVINQNGDYKIKIENNTFTIDENALGSTALNVRNSTIKGNTIHGDVNLPGSYNIVQNNTIYGNITGTSRNNTITDNWIHSTVFYGDRAVQLNKRYNIIENNTPNLGKDYIITEENYNEYFEDDILIEDLVENGSIVSLEDLKNHNIIIKNKNIYITSPENSIQENITITITDESQVIIENMTINNYQDKEYTILLNTTHNAITKCNINTNHTAIIINDKYNQVNNTNININNDENNVSAIIVKGADSRLITNNILMTTDKNAIGIEIKDTNRTYIANYRYLLDITSKEDATAIKLDNSSDIQIAGSSINIQAQHDATAISMNNTSNTRIVLYANISSNENATGLLIQNTPEDSQIQLSTLHLNITSNNALGVLLNNTNNINLTTSYNNNIMNINSNKSIGLYLINTNNSNYNGNITLNATDDSTQAIILEDSNYNNITPSINMTLKRQATLNNSHNNIISLEKRVINSTDTAILLQDSNNNTITNLNITTNNSQYCIELNNSHNNKIYNNSLISTTEIGDQTVKVTSSTQNIIENNTSKSIITMDNYDSYFDENGTFYPIQSRVIELGSDFYNKNFTFTESTNITNPYNYTIYNGTITLDGEETALLNIKINTTNTTNVLTVNSKQFITNRTTIYHENTDITRTVIFNEEVNAEVYGIEITTIGPEIPCEDGLPSTIALYDNSNSTLLNVSSITWNLPSTPNTINVTSNKHQSGGSLAAYYSNNKGTLVITYGCLGGGESQPTDAYSLDVSINAENATVMYLDKKRITQFFITSVGSAKALNYHINANNSNIIILKNSDNNTIAYYNLKSDTRYIITLENVTNSNITGNILNASDEYYAEDAILLINSTDNIIENNTPTVYSITDENYPNYFDEDGNFNKIFTANSIKSNIVKIASDIYNKNMTFNQTVLITNKVNYTIYNGSLTTKGLNSLINNINMNSTDNTETILDITGTLNQSNIYHYSITPIKSIISTGSITNSNITICGPEIETPDNTPSTIGILSKSNGASELTNNNLTITSTTTDNKGSMVAIEYTTGTMAKRFDIYNNTIIVEAKNNATLFSGWTRNIENNNITLTSQKDARIFKLDIKAVLTIITNNTIHTEANNNIETIALNTISSTQQLRITDNNYTLNSNNTTTLLKANTNNNQQVRINNSNININSPNITLTDITQTAYNIANNTIQLTGDNITANKLYNSAKSHDFNNNNINITANNNAIIYIGDSNTGTNNIKNNTILIKGNYIQTPPINLTNTKATITDNHIESRYYNGNDAVVNNTGLTIENNIPTTNGFKTQIKEVTLPETIYAYANNTILVDVTDIFDEKVTGKLTVTDGESTTTTETPTTTYTPTSIGEKTITITYNDPTGKYESTTTTITINTQLPTVTIDPITATVGETANITARITAGDETITDINKGKVTFKVNGKTLKDASGKVIYAKVVNGVATIENYVVPEDWAKEGTTIEAIYSGSTQCEKLTSEKTNLTITPKELTLTTEDTTATIGSTTTLTATLSDNTINTGKIVFKINGKTVKDANGKVIYAKVVNGQVSVEYTIPDNMKAKDYTLTATYISSDYRLEDTKTLTITA